MAPTSSDKRGGKGIGRQIIYILTVLVVLLPLIRPIGMPIVLTHWVERGFHEIDSLQPGNKVLVTFDYSASGAADVHPAAAVIFKHLMDRDVKVITVSFVAEGSRFAPLLMSEHEEAGKVYGEDFVHLGFLSGYETALAALVSDIPGTCPVDSRNSSVSSYPIMEGVKSAADVDMFIAITGGTPGPGQYVRQLEPYKDCAKIVMATVAVVAAGAEPYLDSGQVLGLIAGTKGAAEYETLLDQPGTAVANMDAQSFAHLLVVGLIVVGNVNYFMTRKKTDS